MLSKGLVTRFQQLAPPHSAHFQSSLSTHAHSAIYLVPYQATSFRIIGNKAVNPHLPVLVCLFYPQREREREREREGESGRTQPSEML